MFSFELTAEVFFSFLTLSMLEIVLGIDNLIFIALVVQHIPVQYRRRARLLGLILALVIRLVMLMGASWIMRLTEPFVELGTFALSVKDLLLLAGGVFLIVKSTLEMHADVSGSHLEKDLKAKKTFLGAVFQIVIIDFIFSFDSIITAVGITQNLTVIFAAVIVSIIVMIMASGYISNFLTKYPTFKMLALAFILMIGTLLVAEGLHFHMPREYIYFSFGFSLLVEGLNSLVRKKELARTATSNMSVLAEAKPKRKPGKK